MTAKTEANCTRIAGFAILSALLFVLGLIGVLTSCKKSEAPQRTAQTGAEAPAPERVERNPDRNAYFGPMGSFPGVDNPETFHLFV